MKKFKKILQSAISILMAFVLVFAIGCSKGSEESKVTIKPAPEKPAPTFELNQTKIECIVGDVDKLAPKSLPDIGEATLSWRSDNSQIVTVDNNGNIEAISEGSAKVIATYGNISAECTVNVSWDDELPQIVSPASSDGKFAIVVGQEYSFAPTIQYRGKTYNDAQLSIEVSNDAVTAFDEETSTITGATTGDSRVTISGTWRGKQALKATFNVQVNDDIVLSATDSTGNIFPIDEIDVYTAASFGNKSDQPTTFAFIPTAKVKSDINKEPEVMDMASNPEAFDVVIVNENLVSYDVDEKLLRSKAFGDTIATINFSYNNQTYVKQFFIHLERPVATFNEKVNYFSSLQGTLRDEMDGFAIKTLKDFVYGDQDKTIKTAFVDDQELQIEESTGAIFGITGTSASTYDVVVRIGTDVEQYDVPVTVYGQYVYEPTDLDVFVRTAASPELDVYVELARDLDLANYVRPNHFNDVNGSTDPKAYVLPNHKWITNNSVAKGFMGTFNGNGYYLMNYTQKGGYGFFEGLYEATVKNVGFVNCATEDSAFIATFTKDVVMENVYIKLNSMKKSTSYWPVGVVSNYYSPGGVYKNVYIDTQEANIANVLQEGRDRYYWEVYNSFVAFPVASEYNQPKFENCLVISKAPLSSIGYVSYNEGPRIVVAENTSESDRTAIRQQVWNAQVQKQKDDLLAFYNSKVSADNVGIYPIVSSFDGDLSLILENYNNSYLDNYGGKVERASLVGKAVGVRSYNTIADMKQDATIRDYLNNFSSEFWTVIDGQLNWGKHPANLEDGDVFLDVGILKGKDVQGIDELNPMDGYEVGDTVEIGSLSCFGYIFTGWKDAATGEMIELVDGKYTFTYSGKATILIAQWKIDPDVQVNSGIK